MHLALPSKQATAGSFGVRCDAKLRVRAKCFRCNMSASCAAHIGGHTCAMPALSHSSNRSQRCSQCGSRLQSVRCELPVLISSHMWGLGANIALSAHRATHTRARRRDVFAGEHAAASRRGSVGKKTWRRHPTRKTIFYTGFWKILICMNVFAHRYFLVMTRSALCLKAEFSFPDILLLTVSQSLCVCFQFFQLLSKVVGTHSKQPAELKEQFWARTVSSGLLTWWLSSFTLSNIRMGGLKNLHRYLQIALKFLEHQK